jgi:hypothetical protein
MVSDSLPYSLPNMDGCEEFLRRYLQHLLYVYSLANACYKPKLAMIREQGQSLKFYFLLKLQS